MDLEFGFFDGVMFLMFLGVLILIAILFEQSGFNALIGRLFKKTENVRYKIGDYHYSQSFKKQRIIENTVLTIWRTVLWGGLLVLLIWSSS